MSRADDYSFNIIGLLLCRLNIPFRRSEHFFCSQFVGEILCRSRAVKLPKDTSLMRPCDYMNIPELVCRFTGCLNELLKSLNQPVMIG